VRFARSSETLQYPNLQMKNGNDLKKAGFFDNQ